MGEKKSIKNTAPKENLIHTLHWLFVALHLSAAKPNLNMKAAASSYLYAIRVAVNN